MIAGRLDRSDKGARIIPLLRRLQSSSTKIDPWDSSQAWIDSCFLPWADSRLVAAFLPGESPWGEMRGSNPIPPTGVLM